MRDRLVELLCNVKCEGEECFGNCPYRIGQKCNKVQRLEMCSVFAIADYLLAEGVIVPPVKVGQTIYVLTVDSPTGIEETKISQVIVRYKGNCKIQYTILAPCVYDDWGKAKWSFCDNNFGDMFFLTREEAEQALAERSGNET